MKKIVNHIVGGVLVFGLIGVPLCLASELTVPNQFSSGDVTSASDVNANFAAIEAAVNDNHARIQEGLQSQSRPVFVGFSEPVSGTSGLNSWQQACHNISAGSHICSDFELNTAPYNPESPIPVDTAWINAEVITYNQQYENYKNEGRIASCNSSNSYDTSPYVISGGKTRKIGSCEIVLPVACCK